MGLRSKKHFQHDTFQPTIEYVHLLAEADVSALPTLVCQVAGSVEDTLGTRPIYTTAWGALFGGDCLDILPAVAPSSIDSVFADPPFNIGKDYGDSVNDRMAAHEYLTWCERWIDECIRVLKDGGSFFLYNIPKWNIYLANVLLERGMHFRDWIVIDIKLGLPIPGRLYPSHYSLLYFTKGKPKTFRNIRTPIKQCRHCGGDVKDYGGHRSALNPNGLNLTDVWNDIPPVRHWKLSQRNARRMLCLLNYSNASSK